MRPKDRIEQIQANFKAQYGIEIPIEAFKYNVILHLESIYREYIKQNISSPEEMAQILQYLKEEDTVKVTKESPNERKSSQNIKKSSRSGSKKAPARRVSSKKLVSASKKKV